MFSKLMLRSHRWLIGFGIFFLSITGTFVITSLLPRTYIGSARLVVHKAAEQLSDPEASSYDPYLLQTAFEILKSRRILYPVIQGLQLDRKWDERYGAKISPQETYRLLRNSMEVRQFRNTSMLEVRVYDENGEVAAEIANQIGEEFCRFANSDRPGFTRAAPSTGGRAKSNFLSVTPLNRWD